MAILLDKHSQILIQGITERYGSFHTRQMLEYGTVIVGGVTPGKGGDWFEGKPVFDTVRRAMDATGATVSLITVPAPLAADAIIEAADAGIKLIICITEHIPLHDMLRTRELLQRKNIRLVGPNSPGILIPGVTSVGIIPPMVAKPGNIGIVSSSSALLYETTLALTQANMGQSALVGIGSNAIIGMNFKDILELFENDLNTEKIVLISEPSQYDAIHEVTSYISNRMTRPVVALIPGQSISLIESPTEAKYAASRAAALTNIGVPVARYPEDVSELLKGV